ncbi:MAG: hypothetical protein LQ351_000929 [Letrouitia transgressa]|nr:MAG: hypothetical protein LQ351_000929 [Letrouitia transgressa]
MVAILTTRNNLQVTHHRPPRRTFRQKKSMSTVIKSEPVDQQHFPSQPLEMPGIPSNGHNNKPSLNQQQQLPPPTAVAKKNTFPFSSPSHRDNDESNPAAIRSLFRTIVTVTVGREQQPFPCHLELLCSVSPFFAAAFSPTYNFREHRAAALALPAARPCDFEYLVQWMYTQTLTHEELAPLQGGPAFFRLIRLWILADELRVEGAKNAAVDQLASVADQANAVPTPEDTHTVFEEAREGCALAALVLDLFVYKRTEALVEGHEDCW